MKAAVLKSSGKLKYQTILARELMEGETKIAVKASGICSSDIGRVFGEGAYSYPIILGHEIAGEVKEINNCNNNLSIGDKCIIAPLIPCNNCEYCLKGNYSLCDKYDYIGSRRDGGYSEFINVPGRNVIKIPPEIDYNDACLVEPVAVVLHGLLKLKTAGKKVLVIGAGSLGLIAAQIARLFGCLDVMICDVFESHLDIAKELGIETIIADNNLKNKLNNIDIVIDTSGSAPGFINSLSIMKKGGSFLVFGTLRNSIEIEKELINRITKHELTILGSWNSYSTPFPGIEWKLAIEFIKKRQLNIKILISHVFKLSEAEKAFNMIQGFKKGELVKAVFTN